MPKRYPHAGSHGIAVMHKEAVYVKIKGAVIIISRELDNNNNNNNNNNIDIEMEFA